MEDGDLSIKWLNYLKYDNIYNGFLAAYLTTPII